jgi:hypothetical protein
MTPLIQAARGSILRRAAPVILLLPLAIAPALFWRGGLIEREATVFVPHYLEPGRSLARKVFDPAVNDRKTYQSREVSHLFDAIDAGVLAALWLVPALLAVLFILADVVRRPGPGASDPRLPLLCVACLALGLLDRHGFLLVIAAGGVLGACARRHPQLRLAGWALAAAVLLLAIHTVLVGPLLTRLLNGYWPDLRFQASPPFAVLKRPRYLLEAAEVLAQQVGLLMGGAPCWAWLTALGLALPWAGLMIARHSALYRLPDHRLWYYPLPLVALLCFGVLLLVEWLSPRLPRRGRAALAAALAALSCPTPSSGAGTAA